KPFTPCSVILQGHDGRVFFVIRLKDRCRIGTTERLCADPDTVFASEAEIAYLLESTRRYFPQVSADKTQILVTDAGVRPLGAPDRAESANEISRDHEIRTDKDGVLSIVGVKLTDHRRAAQKTVDWLVSRIKKIRQGSFKPCLTARTRL
ncbi:MAG: FAD-dependent oxidoreductase, partial [Candidatus Omnitrophota bacterium]